MGNIFMGVIPMVRACGTAGNGHGSEARWLAGWLTQQVFYAWVNLVALSLDVALGLGARVVGRPYQPAWSPL